MARHQVFVLADGTFVVQWDDKRVQELLSGVYREYDHMRDFGHAITEYELKQLRAAGRVEHYNPKYVWLFPLPEVGRFSRREMDRGSRVRGYYLATSLPRTEIQRVRQVVEASGFDTVYKVTSRANLVAILGEYGVPFRTLEDAEAAQAQFEAGADAGLPDTTVAFVEIDLRTLRRMDAAHDAAESSSLDELIASQDDATKVTAGRQVVVAVSDAEERGPISSLFIEMRLDVKLAETAWQALEILEDNDPDLLVMDLQLPDMHGWQLLRKVKEIEALRDLPILIIVDEPSLTMTVAKVDYMTRPVSIARLRLNVWKILHERVRSRAD